MTRLRGRCPRGKRLVAKVPHGHWKMTTFVAGLRQNGMTAPLRSAMARNRTGSLGSALRTLRKESFIFLASGYIDTGAERPSQVALSTKN